MPNRARLIRPRFINQKQWLFSSVKRAGMRRLRLRNGTSANVQQNIRNSATRAALRASLEQHGCPEGVASLAWARHSGTKCELLRGETSWRSILKKFKAVPDHISRIFVRAAVLLAKKKIGVVLF